MATPPLRTELSNAYPNPSNSVLRTGMGKLWDYVTELLGATGTPADARTALGAAKSGANSDITSLTGITTPLTEGQGGTGTTTVLAAVKTAANAAGSAPIYACRAWVNFNGTGIVAIRASGNVSSITDNGTGDYTMNFSNAIEDANYAESMSFIDSGGRYVVPVGTNYAKAVGSFRTGVLGAAPSNPTSFAANDMDFISVSIFR